MSPNLQAAYRPDIGPKLDCVVHFFEVALKVRDPSGIVHSRIRCRAGDSVARCFGLNRAAILGHLNATLRTDQNTAGKSSSI